MSTLQDILSDEPIADEPTADPVAEVIEAVAEPAAQPRDDSGRFAPKGETESASPAPVEESPKELDHPALIGERRRRQEAEARIAEMEARLAQLSQPQAPIPSVFEDEQAWQQNFGTTVVSQAVSQATLNARLDMSEMFAARQYQDFADMKGVFLNLMQQNPALQQQALADPDPWGKAYQIAKNYTTMQSLGAVDVDSLREKLREELKAELTAQTAVQTPTPTLPVSLADGPSSRASAGNPVSPPSLADIIGR